MKPCTRRFATAFLALLSLLVAQWVMAAGSCVWMSDASTMRNAAAASADNCPEKSHPATCERQCAFGDAALDHAKPQPALDITQVPHVRVELPLVPVVRVSLRPQELPPDPPPSIRFSVLRI